jgi:ribose transport system substrate-binding protein
MLPSFRNAQSRRRWSVGGVGAALVLAIMLSASSPMASGSSVKAASDKTSFTIIAIAKSLDNPVYAVAKRGAEVRIAQLKKDGITVKLQWEAPSDGSEATEASMIDSAIGAHPDGMMLDSLGPAVCTAVNEAVKAKIPTIMFDSDCPGSLRSSYVGSDNYQGGIEAAKLFVEDWNKVNKGVVPQLAILITDPGAFNIGQRANGFTAELKTLKFNYKLVTQPQGDDDIAKSVDAVETTLQGNSRLNAFYFAQPLPLLAAGNQLPNLTQRVKTGKMVVVSFDTVQQELKWIENGIVYGEVGQRYYDWGYEGMTVMLNLAKYGSTYPAFVNTGLDIVTKAGGPGRNTAASFEVKWNHFAFADLPIKPTKGKYLR